jgi:hypothetical protein
VASQTLFEQLYEQAINREHVLLNQVARLKLDNVNTMSWPAAAAMLHGIKPISDSFDREILAIARRNKMRVREGHFYCPLCNNPDCPDAIFVPAGYQIATPAQVAAFFASK